MAKSKVVKAAKRNWYGFNEEQVNKHFTGGLTFLNTFCVKGNYMPSAVYKVKKPDKSKGHKEFMLLTGYQTGKSYYVTGMSKTEMNEHRYQDGIRCLRCNDVIFSVNRHDMTSCKCKNATVDGGKNYFKYSTQEPDQVKIVKIDLLTGKLKNKVVKRKKSV